MASEMNINGITYSVVQINGQKIAEATNYYGPAAPENAEIYINNIPRNWTEKEILPIITVPGFVVKLRLMMLFSGDNRGFFYALYANTEMAHNALNYLMMQPVLGVRLYVAWSHNNKNLIMTGIYSHLTKEHILNKILSVVKPCKINIQVGTEDTTSILTFPTHRDAAMARRSLILHVVISALVLLTMLIYLLPVHSQLSTDRRFTNKYSFPGVDPEDDRIQLKIELIDLNSTKPHLSTNMTRSTDVNALHSSCRHFPIRSSINNSYSMSAVRQFHPVPIDYFTKGSDMVVESPTILDGRMTVTTKGYQSFTQANKGLQAYFIDTSLETKEFFAFSTIYPFRASGLFFGLNYFIHTFVHILFELPKGYAIVTGADVESTYRTNLHHNQYDSSINPRFTFYGRARLSEISFIIMRNFSVLYKNDHELRLVADQYYNKTFDISYMSFAHTAAQVHSAVKLIPFLGDQAQGNITVAIAPLFNLRPLLFGHRMCLYDAIIATYEPHTHQYLLTLCMVHQQMSKSWAGENAEFHYMFEGIRELFTLKLLDQMANNTGQTLMMQYFLKILSDDEEVTTATVIGRMDMEYVSKQSIIYKTVILLNMIEGSFDNSMEFMALLLKAFNTNPVQRSFMNSNTFCMNFEKEYKAMGYPKNQTRFCNFYFRWLHSIGFPILKAEMKDNALFLYANNSRLASKQPFLFPLRFVLVPNDKEKNSTVFKTWMSSNANALRVETEDMGLRIRYYCVNPNVTTLMRLNYDLQNWKNLLDHGKELGVPMIATMIVDSYYFFSQGELPFQIVVASLQLLKGVKTKVVWEAIDFVLSDMNLFFRDTEIYDWFLNFLANLVHEYFTTNSPREAVAIRFACLAKIKTCQKEAWSALQEFVTYRQWLPGRDAFLCSGMRVAPIEYYLHLEQMVAKKDRDRNLLLIAMTCFPNPPLLRRLLRSAYLRNEFNLSKEFQYKLIVHMYIASEDGAQAVWKFFMVNYKRLHRDYGGVRMDYLVTLISRGLSSKYHFRTMRQVLKSMKMHEQKPQLIADMLARFQLLKSTRDELKKILLFQ